MKKNIISIHLWTECFLGSAEKASAFLTLMKMLDGGRWKPDKWSQFEPINNVFTAEGDERLIRDWTEERHGRVSNIMLFKKRKPKLLLYMESWKGEWPKLNYLWLDVEANEFSGIEGVERLKGILSALLLWSGGIYATAWHSEQRHYRSAPGNPTQRLDQLNWMTFLGAPYLALFGVERVRACPFYSCEPIADGLLVTAAELPNSASMTESDEVLLKLERCLGSNAFATEDYPQTPCRVPTFDLTATVNLSPGV